MGASIPTMASLQQAVDALATQFAGQRAERQRRRALDLADFAQLRDAGFLLTGVPTAAGGLWEGTVRSTRPLAELLRTLAHGDASVALVASMHPAVLYSTDWLARPEAPEPYRTAWDAQRQWAFQTACAGAWWTTIVSEPGTGGDSSKSTSRAVLDTLPLAYRVSGDKHFGSGSGLGAYVITTAVAEGEVAPDMFFIGMQDRPWDGTAGVTLLGAWDGHGMTATQSHALRFRDCPATRVAWPAASRAQAPREEGFVASLWAGIILGIVETAVDHARAQVQRRGQLRAYEQVEWTRVELETWLMAQAYEGMLRAVEGERNAVQSTRLGKTAVAELAESALSRLCKVIGGSSFSRGTPYGFWLADVRALGFLRPPWGLAFDALFEGSMQGGKQHSGLV
ncbi:MAG: hypothetical protein ACYDCQ_05415 [Dehalococcoidia bacterium]